MLDLTAFDSCIVCGSKEYSTLATQGQLQEEIRFRDHLVRRHGLQIRNRINLADAQECKQYAIPEQIVFLARVQWASDALTRLSLGKAIKGRWIQVDRRKLDSTPDSWFPRGD